MFKTNALDSVANAYVDEDIGTSTPGTRIEADDQNIKQDEITNAVEESGQTLDSPGTFTNNDQLSKAIQISSIGHIDGLILSNGTDTDHDIDITDGACSLKDGSGNHRSFECLSNPTKQIDVNWAEGNNDGGFPSGLTLAADTEYNFFIIGKDDGTIDAGFDTDDDATNLLADATGYTWYRRILSVFTDGSLNILAFLQCNDFVTFDTRIVDVNDSSTVVDVYETGTLTIPKNSVAVINAYTLVGSSESTVGIDIITKGIDAPVAVTGSWLYVRAATSDANFSISANGTILVDVNSQIEYVVTTGVAGSTVLIKTIGWWDNRGRNL